MGFIDDISRRRLAVANHGLQAQAQAFAQNFTERQFNEQQASRAKAGAAQASQFQAEQNRLKNASRLNAVLQLAKVAQDASAGKVLAEYRDKQLGIQETGIKAAQKVRDMGTVASFIRESVEPITMGKVRKAFPSVEAEDLGTFTNLIANQNKILQLENQETSNLAEIFNVPNAIDQQLIELGKAIEAADRFGPFDSDVEWNGRLMSIKEAEEVKTTLMQRKAQIQSMIGQLAKTQGIFSRLTANPFGEIQASSDAPQSRFPFTPPQPAPASRGASFPSSPGFPSFHDLSPNERLDLRSQQLQGFGLSPEEADARAVSENRNALNLLP